MQKFIRKTMMADLPAIMQIYSEAQEYMRQNGNPGQWGSTHPPQHIIEADIAMGTSYVCVINGDTDASQEKILATFFLTTAPDPTYTKIDGAWVDDTTPYGTIHRIARSHIPAASHQRNTPQHTDEAKGVGEFCIHWCFTQIPNIRIDTHPQNTPMLKLMDKMGFTRCGIIWLENGDERIAFQRIAND